MNDEYQQTSHQTDPLYILEKQRRRGQIYRDSEVKTTSSSYEPPHTQNDVAGTFSSITWVPW